MKEIMKHTIHFSAVLLFFLFSFIPADAQRPSFTVDALQQPSTTPIWIREIQHTSLVNEMNIGKDESIYIASDNKIMKYNKNGTQSWIKNVSLDNKFENFTEVYDLTLGNDFIYASEGPSAYMNNLSLDIYGGIRISAYLSYGDIVKSMFFANNVSSSSLPGFILGLGSDDAGNIYAAGIYNDPLVFGSDTLKTFDRNKGNIKTDVFLVSYAPNGQFRWIHRIGGKDEFDTITADCAIENSVSGVFIVDNRGNTYFGGCFSKGAVFGEDQLGEVVIRDSARALVSFDSDGNLRWVHTLEDMGIQEKIYTDEYGFHRSPYISDMTIDSEGNLFTSWVVPYSQTDDSLNSVVIGNMIFMDPDGSGAFFIKHKPDGNIVWIRQVTGMGNKFISDLVTDFNGNIYISGLFNNNVLHLEEYQLFNSYNDLDSFIAGYDTDGNLFWLAHATGPGIQYIDDIETAGTGNIYIAGQFTQTLHLGLKVIEDDHNSMFLAKYAASTITSSEFAPELPAAAALTSNYPNPFTHTTTIEYALPVSGPVRLAVYDALGREVATLVDGVRQAGSHVAVFDGTSLSSGVYLYRLEAAGQAKTGLMTLRK